MRLIPYQEYRNCRLPWLHSIPAHWGLVQMKRVFVERVQKGCPDEPLLAATQTKGVVPKDQYGARTVVATKDLHLLKLVEPGDYVISLRSFEGGIEHSDYCGIISPAYTVLRPAPDIVDGYFRPLLKCEPFVSGLTLFVTGIREGQNIDYDRLSRSILPFPPRNEQRAIGSFLGTIVPYINRLIRAKHRQIELLNEQKQVIINRAVTRGLDPNVRLKPSGVEWLGDIPEHWEVVALGVRYWVQLGKMLDAKKITGDYLVPYLRNADVQWDRVNSDNLPMMDICEHEYERYLVQPGDLLVCEGGDIGRSAFWNGSLPRCGYQKALHRLRPRDTGREYPRFLFYVMFAASRQGVFVADGSENTIAHLTAEKLRHHRFAFPSMEEQQHIACYLDVGTAGLTMAAEKVQQEIDLLREYRTRLIADVVTGKLDVRGVELPDLEGADIADDLGDSDFGSDTDQDDLPDAEEVEADDED